MSATPYEPTPVRIRELLDETADVRTFVLEFEDEGLRSSFRFRPGQFGLFSVTGEGESTFCLSAAPAADGSIQCSFKALGRVTSALRRLDVGDRLGFRGPYGNSFPLEEFRGQNLVFIGGGIGIAPLRPVIQTVLAAPSDYGRVTILGAARTVADLPFRRDFAAWAAVPEVSATLAVDPGGQTPDWQGKVGLAPNVLKELAPSPADAIAVLCGPPVMIKFTGFALRELGFAPERTYTTLENRMKCGIGKCGRCNVGPFYVCKDGPVLTMSELAHLPDDM